MKRCFSIQIQLVAEKVECNCRIRIWVVANEWTIIPYSIHYRLKSWTSSQKDEIYLHSQGKLRLRIPNTFSKFFSCVQCHWPIRTTQPEIIIHSVNLCSVLLINIAQVFYYVIHLHGIGFVVIPTNSEVYIFFSRSKSRTHIFAAFFIVLSLHQCKSVSQLWHLCKTYVMSNRMTMVHSQLRIPRFFVNQTYNINVK